MAWAAAAGDQRRAGRSPSARPSSSQRPSSPRPTLPPPAEAERDRPSLARAKRTRRICGSSGGVDHAGDVARTEPVGPPRATTTQRGRPPPPPRRRQSRRPPSQFRRRRCRPRRRPHRHRPPPPQAPHPAGRPLIAIGDSVMQGAAESSTTAECSSTWPRAGDGHDIPAACSRLRDCRHARPGDRHATSAPMGRSATRRWTPSSGPSLACRRVIVMTAHGDAPGSRRPKKARRRRPALPEHRAAVTEQPRRQLSVDCFYDDVVHINQAVPGLLRPADLRRARDLIGTVGGRAYARRP